MRHVSLAKTPDENTTTTSCPTTAGIGSRRALYVDSPIYRRSAYGTQHPLAIARTETVTALCTMLDWLPAGAVRQSAAAPADCLSRFHDPDYIAALQRSDTAGRVERATRLRHGIGTMENPLFAGVYERAATTVGGSILAAELALEGRIVFHPAGGTHHGRPARASGFCYFNDPVFALDTMLAAGLDRVMYIDLDAHHGDGVEDAFKSDARLFLLSIHENGRWPYTGSSGLNADGRICNLAVPTGLNDDEFEYLMDNAVLPFARDLMPQALVITCGADVLDGDPLSTMCLSNVTLWRAVHQLTKLAEPVVVLGGGGYNPWTVARYWAGLWAQLADFDVPDRLPAEAQRVLERLECDLVDDEDVDITWLTQLADQRRRGPVREEVKTLTSLFDV